MISGEARVDRIFAGILVGFGLVVLALASELPGPTPADPVSPRGFPALLALVIVICGVSVGVASWTGRRAAADDLGEPRGRLTLARLLLGLGLTAGYLAILERAGYPIATPLYLTGLLLAQGGVGYRVLLWTALGLPAALYFLFAVVMRVPLPAGPLDPFLRGF